jgi:WD40 repeat protein
MFVAIVFHFASWFFSTVLAWVGGIFLLVSTCVFTFRRLFPARTLEVPSPNGLYCAVVGTKGISVKEQTTKSTLTFISCRVPLHSLVWSPDSSCIAAKTKEGMVRAWNAWTQAPLFLSASLVAQGTSVAWSPNSTRLALVGPDRSLQVWDTISWKILYQSLLGSVVGRSIDDLSKYAVYDLAWSTSGTWLAFSDSDVDVRVWNSQTSELYAWHDEQRHFVTSLAFAEGVSCLLSGNAAGKIYLWDFRTGKELWSRQHSRMIILVSWGQDGGLFAWDDSGTIIRWSREEILSALQANVAISTAQPLSV